MKRTLQSIVITGLLHLLAVNTNAQRRDPDLFAEEERRHPALRLAEEGKFTEAYRYVERGEDTQAYYERGVKYYNFWAPRTNRRTPSGKPDPSMMDMLNEVNEDKVRANEELMRRYQVEADKGNKDAQAWLDKYARRIEGARITQDAISEGRKAERRSNPASTDSVDPPDASRLLSRWTGTWQGRDGHRFTYRLQLDMRRTRVDGRILWKLAGAPKRSALSNRVGDTGIEYVQGTFEPETRKLHLRGTRVDDPKLLATDEYRLVVAPDGQTIEGRTRGNSNDWTNELKGQKEQ